MLFQYSGDGHPWITWLLPWPPWPESRAVAEDRSGRLPKFVAVRPAARRNGGRSRAAWSLGW